MRVKDILFIISCFILAAGVWVLNFYYDIPSIANIIQSLILIGIAVAVHQILVRRLIMRSAAKSKTHYGLRKAVSAFIILSGGLALIAIWIRETQLLIVGYGVLAAGLAIAFQDIFKNIAGTLVLLLTRPYTIGDRIEVDGVYGDVIDIGSLQTALLEIRSWVDGDQASGRIVVIPNLYVITRSIFNYTMDHDFLWDEVTISLTYDSNWKDMKRACMELLKRETKDVIKQADRRLSKLQRRYFIEERVADPNVYVSFTDNYIQFKLRYVVHTKERRAMKSRVMEGLLVLFEEHDDVYFGGSTLTVTNV